MKVSDVTTRLVWRCWMALCCGVLASCATPDTQYRQVDQTAVAAQQVRTQQDIIQTHLALATRLHTIAWPLVRDNVALCQHTSKAYIGAQIGNDKSLVAWVTGLTLQQVRTAGFDQRMQVLVIAQDSPAARAGLQLGDVVETINGKPVTAKNYAARWHAAVSEQDAQQIQLGVRTHDTQHTVSVQLVESCAYTIHVQASQKLNAYTDGKKVFVTSSLLRQVTDDRLLAFVIGHELAHAGLDHIDKQLRNYVVTGSIVFKPILNVVGFVVDTVLGIAGVELPRMPGEATAEKISSGLTRQRDFEREADYVGMYFYARCGGDLSDVERFFTLVARIYPSSTWGQFSHPVTPERILAVTQTRAEILQKQAAGQPLLPNGYVPPAKRS